MIICPVCEHQQAQGVECAVCGKKLVATAPVAVPVTTLPDLEQTRRPSTQNVAVQPVPELDTGRAPAINLNVTAAPLPVDTGRAEPDGYRTALPSGPTVCRYCRNVQESGALCDRCGMRLPRVRQAAEAPVATKPVQSGDWVDCSKCRTTARAGRACPTCGTHIPADS